MSSSPIKLKTLTVLPDTPEPLKPLSELAYNLYFSWNSDVVELFQKCDPELWDSVERNPIALIDQLSNERTEELLNNSNFMVELETVYGRYKQYMEAVTWYDHKYNNSENTKEKHIAYFSCEFGFNEALPIYSGGLGVLSGDHIKSASDLGIPLVGVGLLYKHGYFRQHLNSEGFQQETYPENDIFTMPLHIIKDKDGNPITGKVNMAGEDVFYHIWEVKVGRATIYLLDANVEENSPHHRAITNNLYDSDRDIRIRQEILLGMGGYQALRLLGLNIKTYHINEGHSAFLLIERLRHLMKEKEMSYSEASLQVWSTTLFTTHTPVPAGNERFTLDLIQRYFSSIAPEIKLSWRDFVALGREYPDDQNEEYCMTILALKLASKANGVSKLHGVVSRDMWKSLYPGIPQDEIPIGHVTNGIHASSWLSPHLKNLISRYLKPSSSPELQDFDMWEKIGAVPDVDLWELHQFKKKKMVEFLRNQVRSQYIHRKTGPAELGAVDQLFDPKVLTIGFGRRFATYKRGDLFLRNPERLSKILNDPQRPVQIVFTGKAHPADEYGKAIIKNIFDASVKENFKNRIIFLEDYDISIARELLHGVDVWLNNPIRPKEASGTSGMKAAINGAINLSILDGWWDEAYTSEVGWCIGDGENITHHADRDIIEADLLYGELEREIVPLYYTRDEKDVPRAWVEMMKNSIKSLGVGFNCHRMLANYQEKYYHPLTSLGEKISDNSIKELSAWKEKISARWGKIKFKSVSEPAIEAVKKGSSFEVWAKIDLAGLNPDNVLVECYHGPTNSEGVVTSPIRTTMEISSTESDVHTFKCDLVCETGGRYGYTVRVLPGHPLLSTKFMPGFLKWMDI